MDAVRLRQIEDLYHAALEIPAADRPSFVESNCGADQELLQEIESLLTVEISANNLFAAQPGALAAAMYLENADSIKVGTQINQYKIISLLGKGGMGEVFLAEDTKLDRQVAVKFLNRQFDQNTEKLNRFIREAKAASALNHPNILTVYEIGENDGSHFIVTEFIDGKILNQSTLEQSLSLKSVLEISIQIASALQATHKTGIVHRDIKPDNLMIRQDGIVKILDFGLAKLTNEPANTVVSVKDPKRHHHQLISEDEIDTAPPTIDSKSPQFVTNVGVIMGTPNYMSPEQAKGGDINHQTDIFSFGIVFYEMVFGKLPFQGNSSAEVIDAILHKEPEKLNENDVPESVVKIVDKCLKKPLNERYGSIEELLTELKVVAHDINSLNISQREVSFDKFNASTGSDGQNTASGIVSDDRQSLYRFAKSGRLVFAVALVFIILFSMAGVFGYKYIFPTKRIRSIAVMPFVNESGNTDVEYLSDGMTENLIGSLSNIPNLAIKARSTVFSYKGKEIVADKVGAELKVDAILLGNFVKVDNDLRINLELIDTSTQDVIWSENYTRKISNLAALQIEIARDVSEKLRLKLSADEQNQIEKSYTKDPEAEKKYLKGRFHWNRRNIRDNSKAIIYFEQAINIDPKYSKAYAGLADAYLIMPLYGSFKPNEYIPKAKNAALKALELDENLADAHATLGYIYAAYYFDWNAADQEFRKSISINPNYPTARQWYAEHLSFRGKPDQALHEISKALELDPFSLPINRMKGNILGFANRHDEAIDQHRKTMDLFPENSLVRINLGEALASKKMYPEAVEQFLFAFKLDGMPAETIQSFTNEFSEKGWQGFWNRHLKNILLEREKALKSGKTAYFSDESVAFAYAAAKNKEKALEFLEKAYSERDISLVTIGMSEAYNFLKDEPRFKELIKKIGLKY